MWPKYNYAAFGLQFESEILLPELDLSPVRRTDVQIVLGKVPDKLDFPYEEQEVYQAAEKEFLFRLKGVASYYVTKGEKIVVQLCTSDLTEVRLFLLGTVMGVLLMQRKILPIHGSSVIIGGQSVIFAGVSGAGKSTIAAALHQNGCPLLADDISAVRLDLSGRLWVQAAYPQQKLWLESAESLGIDTQPLRRICEQEDKYALPVRQEFWRQPARLKAVYEINRQTSKTPFIRAVRGVEKIAVIMHHTYRAGFLKGLGLRQVHFEMCARIAKEVPVFRLARPESLASLAWQVEHLKYHLAESPAAGETLEMGENQRQSI